MSVASTTATVQLTAPLTGIMLPIEQVPDPVFAKKMVGEGFSIDPLEGRLLAPIAGEVADLQPSHHAITIRSAEGLEVLLHIGLDTVRMQGEGFTPKVKEGDHVEVGDELIEFDLDVVATHAKRVLTQTVIANSDMVASLTPSTGLVTAGSDVAAEVVLAEQEEGDAAASGGKTVTSEAILVPNPTGLHARPAARLAQAAQAFSADVQILAEHGEADAKSILDILSLAAGYGSRLTLVCSGEDAEAAAQTLRRATTGTR